MGKTCYYINILAHILLFQIMPCLAISSTSLATDQSALLAFKSHITLDPNHTLTTNWTYNNSTTSVCNWIGVICSHRHQRVSALNISNMGLSGKIPPHFGNLSFLISLDFSYNFFTGILPHELSFLHRVKVISLTVNNFSGEIPPGIGSLHKLVYLSIRNNSFTGPIPSSLSNLTSLQVLDVSFNSLQGNIPREFGRLWSLKVLNLQYNQLSGPIPSAIFNLSALKKIGLTSNDLNGILPDHICHNLPFLDGIYLSYNQLSGRIPLGLSKCSQLQVLSLSYNSFDGEIPREIGKLKYLQSLLVGSNNLSGVIPPEIGNLQNMVEFSIDNNTITGEIPPNIFNISTLQYLSITQNRFTGVLPQEIGNLNQLQVLGLSFNNLNGLIPQELFNISTLRILALDFNNFSGDLPTRLGHGLPVLEELYLHRNYFSGTIPESISNCTKLRILAMNHNKFTGFVPQSLGNLRLLKYLSLFNNNLTTEPSSSKLSFITSLTNCRFLKFLAISNNPLGGKIPDSIGNFSDTLQSFTAENCKLRGTIPASIGNLKNLVSLYLAENELSGYIPSTLMNMHNLQGLYLFENNLRGFIPQGLCNLNSLYELYLNGNKFSGPIPECLGIVTSLRSIILYSNMLNSSVPSSLWGLKDLLHLDLSSNSLSGFLPPEIGNLRAAVSIDVSMNQFSRTIPSTIGNLQSLVYISLANNGLEGSIPASMGGMVNLETLDLYFNNLSGSIPMSLQQLQYLDSFNVSFNHLSGEIPTNGPFRNFTMECFKFNGALCGIPRFHVPLCHAVSNHKSWKRARLVLLILSGVVAFIIFLSLAIITILRYRRKNNTVGANEGPVLPIPDRISYYELLLATEHYNESNLLGKGSFGSVYKSILRDGKIVAVKVFNLPSQDAFKSFDVECEVLRNIRHRNLTKVISSCSNEDFKALVLEYMPNGSLEKWLYSHNYCLSLVQRLNIMIDVGSALEYLHHGYSIPIVHCNLKPSNILLDEEMVGHVSDFGIAKLLGDGESIVQTNTLASLGYIAPEYGLEGLVSIRCDVYSYGIMLMETFTKKRPSDDLAGDLSLKSWIESSLTTSWSHEVVDANLLNPETEHFDKKLECVSSVLGLALKCSADYPTDRINMKEVVVELKKIKAQFLA